MKNTDLRAKARAIFGPAIAEPMPKQPNGAKALQQRANARPIPTYKVGGPVKKMPTPAESAASGNRMSKQQGDEMRFMDDMEKKKKRPTPAESAASGNRMSRQEGDEMRRMKMKSGGKAGKYADGGMAEEITVEGRRPQNIDVDLNRMRGTTGGRMGPPAPMGGGNGRAAAPMMEEPAPAARGRMPLARTAGYTGPTVDVGDGQATAGIGRRGAVGVGYSRPFKKGGEVKTSSDTARKLATEMGGYKKGGKVKPVDIDMKGLEEASRPRTSLPKADLETKAMEARNLAATRKREAEETAPKKQSFGEAFAAARKRGDKTFSWNGGSYGTQMKGETTKAARAPARATTPARAAPPEKGMSDSDIRNFMSENDKAANASKAARPSMPSEPRVGLRNTKIGSEYADTLDKERARNAKSNQELVERYKKEGRPRLAKIASFLSGAEYAKGGKVKGAKPKDGLAVMIAIGKAKPTKKMNGGPMASGSTDKEASKVTRDMAMGGALMGYAAGGAGKTRKGQAPIKKAQGGAAKVRKGMMTPEGNIIDAMNKMRGK
jgi:hypothetical protein